MQHFYANIQQTWETWTNAVEESKYIKGDRSKQTATDFKFDLRQSMIEKVRNSLSDLKPEMRLIFDSGISF